MSSHVTCSSKQVNPVAILLTSSGSSGDRLIFRYPFPYQKDIEYSEPNSPSVSVIPHGDVKIRFSLDSSYPDSQVATSNAYTEQDSPISSSHSKAWKENPYSLAHLTEELPQASPFEPVPPPVQAGNPVSVLHKNRITGLKEDTLASLLSVKKQLCGHKLEVKLDDAVFVGFPCDLTAVKRREGQTISTFSVVFVMHAVASADVINHYYELAKQVALAIAHEEKRVGYLTSERYIIQRLDDLPDQPYHCPSSFEMCLEESQLCRELSVVLKSMTSRGYVTLRINHWIPVSYCLPDKAYRVHGDIHVTPAAVCRAVQQMRPYHSLLLTALKDDIAAAMAPDSNPTLLRLIHFLEPTRHLQALAADIDASFGHVRQLAASLVHWGKAIVIYPLCETNVYVVTPDMDLIVDEDLLIEFARNFRQFSLPDILAIFAVPLRLQDHVSLPHDKELTPLLTWLLRHRLLVQMHTYVTLVIDQPQSDWPQGLAGGGGDSIDPDSMDILRRYCATDQQLYYLLSLPSAQKKDSLAVFLGLLPYFDGQSHIEQIMFRESKTRIEVNRCIDMFSQVLVTTLLPDPVTSCFAGIG